MALSPYVTLNGYQYLQVNGTTNNDTLTGSTGRDLFEASYGDDICYGLGGNDIIKGQVGNDTIYGGDGDDNIFGGGDSDLLFGGNGNDYISCDGGITNICTGGAGNDTIETGMYNPESIDIIIQQFTNTPVTEYITQKVITYETQTVTDYITTQVTEEVHTPVTVEVVTQVTEEVITPITVEVHTPVVEEVITPITVEVVTQVTEEVHTPVTEYVTSEVTNLVPVAQSRLLTTGYSETFADWLVNNGNQKFVTNGKLNGLMPENSFVKLYGNWLNHLVTDYHIGQDLNGNGKIETNIQQNNVNGPIIEGLNKYLNVEPITIKTGNTTQIRYAATSFDNKVTTLEKSVMMTPVTETITTPVTTDVISYVTKDVITYETQNQVSYVTKDVITYETQDQVSYVTKDVITYETQDQVSYVTKDVVTPVDKQIQVAVESEVQVPVVHNVYGNNDGFDTVTFFDNNDQLKFVGITAEEFAKITQTLVLDVNADNIKDTVIAGTDGTWGVTLLGYSGDVASHIVFA